MKRGVAAREPADGSPAHRPGERPGAAAGSVSRRLILKATFTLPALSALGCTRRTETAAAPQPLAYFSAAEREFIDAATQRLIPDGDDGLGARAAAVTVFIDRQLAGPYGQAATWYMEGPCAKARPSRATSSR